MFNIGDSAKLIREITESDIYSYAKISGDFNPIHIDEKYAKNSIFKTRIAHGMFVAGFISSIIANQLPGEGTIYLKQNLNFLAPVRIGDIITTKVEILELNAKQQIKLKTTCENQKEIIVISGEAVVFVKKNS
jgi:3-hydroxybutyryl-CoA dehydratase